MFFNDPHACGQEATTVETRKDHFHHGETKVWNRGAQRQHSAEARSREVDLGDTNGSGEFGVAGLVKKDCRATKSCCGRSRQLGICKQLGFCSVSAPRHGQFLRNVKLALGECFITYRT